MKYILLFSVFLFTCIGVKGQTFSEWFRQKKTQQKYMLQQIAGLQVYISYAKDGYAIVRSGLNGISQIRDGEFNLHQDFFSSLSRLNPALQKSIEGLAIPELEFAIHTLCRKEEKNLYSSENLGSEEKQYLQRVLKRVEADTGILIEDYEQLTGNGQLALRDDERLNRLTAIWKQLLENHAFIKNLGANISGIDSGRSQERKELSHSLLLNGIKE